jgi:hypothetical protein
MQAKKPEANKSFVKVLRKGIREKRKGVREFP